MSNIPGATNVLPGVFTDVVTDSRGTAIAGGNRIPAIMGEGLTEQVIVSYAVGNGKDGVNSSYTSASGSDGRHFLLQTFPVVANRTQLFRNSVPLKGIEQKIVGTDFSNKYDYRLDPETGRIELHKAFIEDVNGSDYTPFATNKGDGYISDLMIESDTNYNVPSETWTIRCTAVDRNSSGDPLPETARFIAVGSVSGVKLDSSGNKVEWKSNGQIFTNGILSFAIHQSTGVAFTPGDGFTIKVKSGQLNPNDSLTAKYIPTSFLNDPILLQGMDQVVKRFGYPSVDNTLSLGAQLAFANGASSIMAVQCAPSMPRRIEAKLVDSVQAESLNDDDFVFALPLGVTPDYDSSIHFFITNNATGEQTQILPNKHPFYTVGTGGSNPTFSDFINSTSTYNFFYSVVQNYGGESTIASGTDGYLLKDPASPNGTKAILSSVSTSFDSSFVNKTIKITNSDNAGNNAEYVVTAVSNNKAYLEVKSDSYEDWTNATGISFDVVDGAGNVVVGYSGTDGVFVKTSNSTATLSSAAVTFSAGNLRVRINTAGDSQGIYDVASYDSLTDQLFLKKVVVTESDVTWSALDPDLTSDYVVINRYVAPNGYALTVRIVDTKDASFYDAGWINALDSLERTEVDIVVPLPKSTISVIMQNALTHCKVMSNIRNRKERILFTGAIKGLAPANVVGSASDGTNTKAAVEDIGILEGIQGDDPMEILNGEDLANYSVSDAFGSTYRCVYFYPDEIVVQAGSDNITVDGFYIAAAAAGWMAGNPRVEVPLTNKVLSGFTILRTKQFSQLTLESLANSGICVLQPVTGGGAVKWGITTSNSGFAEEQEISIVFIRDRIAKGMRASFAGYVGQPETQTTQIVLGNQAINTLNSFINQGLITDYANLTVQRDSVDPRQWNVLVKVQPTYPVNWIYIRVGVGTI